MLPLTWGVLGNRVFGADEAEISSTFFVGHSICPAARIGR